MLSLGTDLGMRQPMEHVLRQCLIALRLAEHLGLDESERDVVYYTALLAWVGCHIDAYEQAKWFGDDLALKHDFREVDLTAGRAQSRVHGCAISVPAGRCSTRARLGVGFLGRGSPRPCDMLDNHWRAADELAERLGLGAGGPRQPRADLRTLGRQGAPDGAQGREILLASRLVNLADVVEVFHRAGGVEAAVAVARERRGTQFDPALVEVFCRRGCRRSRRARRGTPGTR